MTLPPHATGYIVVDLDRIRANWRALATLVAPVACAAVVKADAYGLGAAQVIPALVREGCQTFFVATPNEAAEARRLAPDAVINVLDGLPQGASAFYREHKARPILSTPDQAGHWADATEALDAAARPACALQIESGLNRLGLDRRDCKRLIGNGTMTRLNIALVMSHLACADDPTHPKNAQQRDAFERLRAELPAAPASLAASDGLMLGAAYHFDLVRPGYALYGGQALPARSTPVEPAVRAYARILQVREIAAGEQVGYSATWQAPGPRRIATIAAGYADGFFRHASGGNDRPGGMVAVGGVRCPVVGRVSMDLITIDVTEVQNVEAGTFAELIGPTLTIEDVGRAAGTIGYEVLTRLGRRFHRVYEGEAA